MVAALSDEGLEGITVLEVGAGAGTAIASMLERGAAAATAVDMSPHHEEAAARVLSERGLGDRVTWHTGDFVDLAADLPRRDIVFLNRVVCCYPYADAMLKSSTDCADRYLAMSYPRDTLLSRAFVRMANWWLRMTGSTFRVFLHEPERMIDEVERAGFERTAGGRTLAWEWRVWKRPVDRPV